MGKKKKKISLYSNLVNSAAAKKDRRMRKKAKYLASLPKNPVKRFFYRLDPRHFFPWLFSKEGLFASLKFFGILFLIGVILSFGTFIYFRRDLKNIQANEISKRVQTTVNTYLDRNGKVLWKDKGDGDYKLVVESDQINDYMKKATIAIEDKDFYDHHGVSFTGILRAAINNVRGGKVQGGSTLTQQLIKQVFFSEEAHERGLKGIPRKIKEVILATEIERLYTKDQIVTMYLNESPYGGRRNGVESGAQTYFGKSAKDLTLAEAALLAAIPNQPYLYNPYYTEGNKYLIDRQHKVLDNMVEIKAITKEEAEKAKKVAILDTIKPEVNQLDDIKAPHFVLEVRSILENKYGVKTIRAGGLTIKTTLDLDAQKYAEEAVKIGKPYAKSMGSDNIALTSIDVATSQVIAMVGSIDFKKPGYGQQNAATSLLEPGSSIKPIIDYTPLFMQRPGINYGPGTILKDENIDKIYCAGSYGACRLRNYSRRFYGNVTIRKALAGSLNIPAVKAMYIVGQDQAADIAHQLGDWSYCKNGPVYLSSAIGGGCSLRQDEHTNAYASLARGGAYKPLSYVLEVTNASGEQLYAWKDEKPKQVVDPQVAYMITSILSDHQARRMTFGSLAYSRGFVIPGVWIAAKTGTTENGHGRAKDSWLMSYSPVIATGIWTGNHDGAPLYSDSHNLTFEVNHYYTKNVHHNVYAKKGKWKADQKIPMPAGLKRMTVMGQTDLWPSWFQGQNLKKDKLVFDKISKKKATKCTPEAAKVEVELYKIKDPVSKKLVYYSTGNYIADKEDDFHKCGDAKPQIVGVDLNKIADNNYKITIQVAKGKHPLDKATVTIGDKKVYNAKINGNSIELTHVFTADNQPINISIIDKGLYSADGQASGPTLDSSITP